MPFKSDLNELQKYMEMLNKKKATDITSSEIEDARDEQQTLADEMDIKSSEAMTRPRPWNSDVIPVETNSYNQKDLSSQTENMNDDEDLAARIKSKFGLEDEMTPEQEDAELEREFTDSEGVQLYEVEKERERQGLKPTYDSDLNQGGPTEQDQNALDEMQALLEGRKPQSIDTKPISVDLGTFIKPQTLETTTPESSIEKPMSKADEYQQLLEERRRKMLGLALAKGAAGIAGEAAKYYGGKGIDTENLFKPAYSLAEQPLKDYEATQKEYKRKQEQKISDIGNRLTESMADPKSDISSVYRGVAAKIPALANVDVSKMSALEFQKMGIKLPEEDKLKEMRMMQEMMRQGEITKRFEQSRVDRIEDKINRVTQNFENDVLVKELKKQDLSFDQANSLMGAIKSGNQVGMAALGTKMARAMGEVGVLTETDVKRYIEAMSLARKAADKFGTAWQGRVSEQTLKDIQDVSKKMQAGFEDKYTKIYDKYVNRAYESYGKHVDLTKEEIEDRFGVYTPDKYRSKLAPKKETSTRDTQSTAPYGDIVERDGKKYKWNATKSKYQLSDSE